MTATVQGLVIDALVDKWTAALDLSVFDGPSLSADNDGEFLMVGYDPISDDGEAASVQQDYKQIGGQRKSERGTIRSAIHAWSGDSTTEPRRKRVTEVFSAAEAAIRADISLGGLVLWASCGPRMDLNQFLTTQGNQVYIRFDLTYEARI